jgi:YHS domain-containing protein
MGGEINKKLFVDVNGKRIYVCCKGCYAPIKKDPEKYIKILKEKGENVETIKKKEN